jgi:ATP-dependent protease Clp ATPase subunit
MMKPMFELPGRDDVEAVTVTAGFVNGTEELKITLKEN